MTPVALRTHGLAKRYRLGAEKGYRTIRESFETGVRRFGRRNAPQPEVWALQGVDLKVEQGEVVGIIGRNGAGKSTLLKILSRITEPTRGSAEVYGRLASLLEIGTGMHPELTGRENIYLSGVLLGMTKGEVENRFDEIVAFADVERFLDTPTKRYSSGMYLRLGFAVAAHLEPELLLVDEVLAVGDASFQRKCLGKMQEIGRSGRAVLFVSHNMPAIARICQRVVLLDEGRVVEDGPSERVVSTYLRSGLTGTAERRWSAPDAPGSEVARLLAVRVVDEAGAATASIDVRRPFGIQFDVEVLRPGHPLITEFSLLNEDGVIPFAAQDTDPRHRATESGLHRRTAWIPGNLLAEGMFIVHTGVITADPVVRHAWVQDALSFLVTDPMEGDSARGGFAGNFKGVVRPLLRWDAERLDS